MTAVFLDLDGTLMDSRPGILAALHSAFHATGHGHLADGDLTWLIGPTFHDTFPRLGITDVEGVIDAYRQHYDGGTIFDARPYDGIVETLDTLRARDCRLYLATAKPHVQARRITAHFGLAPLMAGEFGPELDGTRNWKGDLLAHALEVTGERPETSVMIGDRHHDMAAAAEVGMRAIAVRWGYGSEAEWASAHAVADHPRDLPDLVGALQPSSHQ